MCCGLNFGIVPWNTSWQRPAVYRVAQYTFSAFPPHSTIYPATDTDARSKHSFSVLMCRQLQQKVTAHAPSLPALINGKLLITIQTIWSEGQQRGVCATQRRVIALFECISSAHPRHASCWHTTVTQAHSRRLFRTRLPCSGGAQFWPRPLYSSRFSAVPLDISRRSKSFELSVSLKYSPFSFLLPSKLFFIFYITNSPIC